MLDFEIIVRDQSGNTDTRQNRKFINSCYVSDDLNIIPIIQVIVMQMIGRKLFPK